MAALGERALVEIDVATAVAVSWNPFIKSKANVKRIITTVTAKVLDILHHYSLNYIGYSLTTI